MFFGWLVGWLIDWVLYLFVSFFFFFCIVIVLHRKDYINMGGY